MAKFSDRHLNGLAVEPGQKDRLVFDDCPGLGAGLVPSWRNGPARATRRKVREPLGVWGSNHGGAGTNGSTCEARRGTNLEGLERPFVISLPSSTQHVSHASASDYGRYLRQLRLRLRTNCRAEGGAAPGLHRSARANGGV
jgi:hypothetical protein